MTEVTPSPTGKIARTWRDAYLRGCGLQIVVALLVLPAAGCCICAPLFAVTSLDLGKTGTFLALVIPIGGFLFAAFAIPGAILARRLMASNKILDEMFLPLGLEGRRYVLMGRQYHGEIEGREVDVYYQPAQGGHSISPAKLTVYVSCGAQVSVGIGTADSLRKAAASWLGKTPIQNEQPGWEQREVYAKDETWARSLLADARAAASLLRLSEAPGRYELRNMLIQPGYLSLQLVNPALLTPEAAQTWLHDLQQVAGVAEALPPPAQPEEATSLEEMMRTNRDRFTRPMLIGMVIVLAPLVILTILLFVALFAVILFDL